MYLNGRYYGCPRFLVNGWKYVHGSYRDEYLRPYVKSFILRLKEIKNNNNFECAVDSEELKEALQLLNEQKEHLNHASLKYTKLHLFTQLLFLMNQYVVGTPFPGG